MKGFVREHNIVEQFETVPPRTDYQANVYSDDNNLIVHLWADGKSYDLAIPKAGMGSLPFVNGVALIFPNKECERLEEFGNALAAVSDFARAIGSNKS